MNAENSRSLIESAEQAYRSKDYLAAAGIYERVAQEFKQQDMLELDAEHRNNASVCFLRAGCAEHALNLVLGTDHVFLKVGDIKRQALAAGNQAAAYQALGRLDESEKWYQECIQLFKKGNFREELFDVYANLTSLQIKHGKYLQAIVSMYSGLDYKQSLTLRQRLLKSLLRIPIKMLNIG